MGVFKGYQNATFYRWVTGIVLALSVPSFISLFYVEWYYTLLAILSTLLITKVGQHIGQHRYFAHKSFRTALWKEWLLGFLATLSLTGSPLIYAMIHRMHHKHSDTSEDSHPLQKSFWKAFFVHVDTTKWSTYSPMMVRDLVKNDVVNFFHNWYWHVIFTYLIVLLVIDPLLPLYCWVLPAAYSKFVSGVGTTLVHMWGYRRYDTKDKSVNNPINHLITLGEGNHNNHHYAPGAYDTNIANKWYEYDIVAPIIRKCFEEKSVSKL